MPEVLEALHYLHTRKPSILHRDVKTANILLGWTVDVCLDDVSNFGILAVRFYTSGTARIRTSKIREIVSFRVSTNRRRTPEVGLRLGGGLLG